MSCRDKLKFIPNLLCVIRILLVFVFIYLSLNDMLGAALIVFLVAGATDVLDGFLARRYNWITDLGKILDPFADKLMQCTVLIILSIRNILPIWFAIVFILKEVVTLAMGLLVIKKRNVVVVSKWYGKAAVCLFYATVALSVILRDFLAENALIYALMFVPAAVCAVCAFVAYFKHYYSSLKTPKEKDIESPEANETI